MPESELGLFDGFAGSVLRSSAPLLFALLGETVGQRAGIINLGSEGQMLVGAAFGFGAALATGNPWLGLAVGALAGAALSVVHAMLCVSFGANQFASGLTVWMLGFGISALFGASLVGQSLSGFSTLSAKLAFFRDFTPPTLLALGCAVVVAAFLYWTRWGLVLRAVGESPSVARINGVHADRVQALAVITGGILTGLGGAMLSLDIAQNWAEGMSKGRGLLAAGLVIVARWNPLIAIPTALLFGGTEVLSLRVQSSGSELSPHLLHSLPYLICLVAFIISCVRGSNDHAPAGLRAVLSR